MPTVAPFTPTAAAPGAPALPDRTPTGDAPAPVPVDFAPTEDLPGAILVEVDAPTGDAPGALVIPDRTPTGDAPAPVPVDFTPTEDLPGAIPVEVDVPTEDPPGAPAGADLTPTILPALVVNPSGDAAGLPSMPNLTTPMFEELDAGPRCLKTLTANADDVTAKKIIWGTVTAEDTSRSQKAYQVRAGNDAEALPLIVHPANRDADVNPVLFVYCPST